MNTFLPYPDFGQSARALDNKRLGKQRVEVKQILRALAGETQGWRNHPATRMWQGFEAALAEYGWYCCETWIRRGFKDSLSSYFAARLNLQCATPPWFGDVNFHRAHRSNLIRKLPEHYGPMWPGVPNNLPYVWPV